MSGAAKRWLLVGVIVAVFTGGSAAAPLALQRVDAFAVRRVAVVGTRYLAAEDAVAASGITRADNVFEKSARWEKRLLRHPLVAAVRIDRQLPGTVVLRVTESEPIALVAMPDLRPVDARGRVLPIAPTHALDLPVIGGVQRAVKGRIADAHARAVIAALARLRAAEPELVARVSEAHATDGTAMRLALRNPLHAEVLLPLAGDSLSPRQVRLALADLTARGELPVLRRVDARYTDQVVVSLLSVAGSQFSVTAEGVDLRTPTADKPTTDNRQLRTEN